MNRVGETSINMRLNWKLANDTFGETYHFQKLHKDTVGRIFYGDALSYEALGKNHRFVFPNRGIDRLREQPKDDWRITHGAVIIYYLFPNIQLALGYLHGLMSLGMMALTMITTGISKKMT